MNNQELEKQIRQALQVDPSLAPSTKSIQVKADNGEVTLQGQVSNEKEKEEINKIAEKMAGVTTVNNHLRVAGGGTGASADDQELEKQIRQALQVDPSLAPSTKSIQVKATNGEVTLQGQVPNEKEKEEIKATVEKMQGVKKVDDQLQVASR